MKKKEREIDKKKKMDEKKMEESFESKMIRCI